MLLGVASVDVDQAGYKKIALEILAGKATPRFNRGDQPVADHDRTGDDLIIRSRRAFRVLEW